MKKSLAALIATGLAAGALVAPASAGGKKQHGSFQATAIPFPNLSSHTETEDRGCLAGQEGVHKVSEPFKAGATGTLKAYVEGFTGDWDLFITDTDGKEIIGSLEDQTAGAEAREEVTLPLKKNAEVNIVPCNWAGQPQVEVHWEFTAKGKK